MNVIKGQLVLWGVLIISMRIGNTFACQSIVNCESYAPCSGQMVSRCTRCIYYRGGDKKAYRLSADGRSCTKLCSWRPDSTFCYPGRCADGTPSSCTCAPRFAGNNCLTISAPPVMYYCMGKLKRMVNGLEKGTIEAPCTDSMTSPSIWTNIGSSINSQLQFEAEWETSFQGPSATDWPRHYYIDDHGIGVISASVDWWLQRGGTRVSSGTMPCLDGGISRDNPKSSLHDCLKSTMMTSTPLHGDSFYFTTKSRNGGYVRIRNYDGTSSYTVNPPVYFTGREIGHTAHFTFDFESPYHCSVSGGCTDNMLDRGPAITKNGHLNLRWSGWRDDDAGLGEYEYEVFLLAPFGDELQERYPAITGGRVAPDVKGWNVTLNETGKIS
ncbi:uncharacterized protein LOC118430082 [Branchiostoma floridae]|uniref:Uncharacterized protein LOC118430082 n=1 Tax=Branchiostoma floridae TaxID=7739 RepID=A0A9J7M9U1_BRAFL|nr:uncharacterized protein LOC118430082 [Branchiostoma floridae]